MEEKVGIMTIPWSYPSRPRKDKVATKEIEYQDTGGRIGSAVRFFPQTDRGNLPDTKVVPQGTKEESRDTLGGEEERSFDKSEYNKNT